MRTITELIFVSILAFSSAFFIAGIDGDRFGFIKEAEALCPIGSYVNQGSDGMTAPQGCETQAAVNYTTPDTAKIVKPIMNTLAALVLAGSVISFVYSGYEFITYAQDPQKLEKAKSRLLHTGLAIIVALSIYTLYTLFAGIAL